MKTNLQKLPSEQSLKPVVLLPMRQLLDLKIILAEHLLDMLDGPRGFASRIVEIINDPGARLAQRVACLRFVGEILKDASNTAAMRFNVEQMSDDELDAAIAAEVIPITKDLPLISDVAS